MLFLIFNTTILFLLSLLWSLHNLSFSIDLNYDVIFSVMLSLNFLVDKVSVICSFMLICCSIIAVLFYWHYFSWHSDYLIILIQLFILSMLYLVFTNSHINSFIGWEYLGVVSYFLILYFSIYCSSRSAFITLITSRLGDMGFFLFIGLMLSDLEGNLAVLSVILFSFLLMSKSAVFPMGSWLLEAMRAPTPVSSLVHSSTLVAAGVWLFSRYIDVFLSNYCVNLIFLFCLITVIYSATSAYFFNDTKKIIALSTCNNVSWCFIYIYFGYVDLGLLQLLTHGIFKCILFCLIGDFLLNSSNSQNKSLHFFNFSYFFNFTITLVSFFICGLPFLGVFFTKHFFVSLLNSSTNLIVTLILLVGLSLSFLYSFRLVSILNGSSNGSSNGFNNIYYIIGLPFPLLFFLNSWISSYLLEDSMPTLFLNLLSYFLIICFSIIGLFLNFSSSSKYILSFFGQDFIVNDSMSIYSLFYSLFYWVSIFRWEQSSFFYFISLSSYISTLSNSLNSLILFLSLYFSVILYLFIG
uniref:NADH:ubiquinone reductase (H(+)-translocating) n=1 Tax=Paragyrodactylus variegatus TaxID=1415179 RepID=A0A076VCX8_9PLAT|nr:NADH dehydrogenase subunit 5 [Paragyrodactylus variegatus]AIK25769.1 NADH dehydrogenase subunit 5 [Paragyrodactylus variegatus]